MLYLNLIKFYTVVPAVIASKFITSITAGVLATSDTLKIHFAFPILLKEHGITFPVTNPVPKSDAN